MKPNTSMEGKRIWIEADLINSKAWHSLSGYSAKLWLHIRVNIWVFHRKTHPDFDENKPLNWDRMEMSAAILGVDKKACKRSMHEFLEKGFFDVKKPGENPNSRSIYSLSDRWKKYGKPDFKECKYLEELQDKRVAKAVTKLAQMGKISKRGER